MSERKGRHMSEYEKQIFLEDARAFKPHYRKKLIIECLEKAKALLEQELNIDQMYRQMDYKTMGTYEQTKYSNAIKHIEIALNEVI